MPRAIDRLVCVRVSARPARRPLSSVQLMGVSPPLPSPLFASLFPRALSPFWLQHVELESRRRRLRPSLFGVVAAAKREKPRGFIG